MRPEQARYFGRLWRSPCALVAHQDVGTTIMQVCDDPGELGRIPGQFIGKASQRLPNARHAGLEARAEGLHPFR